jgi:hypothetical protein
MSASLSSALAFIQSQPVPSYLIGLHILSGASKLGAPHSWQRIFCESHPLLVWRLVGLGELAIAVGIQQGIALAITYEYMFWGAVLYTLLVYPPALPFAKDSLVAQALLRLLTYVPALLTLAATIRLYMETAPDPAFVKVSAQIYLVGNILMGLVSGAVGASMLATEKEDERKTEKSD